MTGRFVASVVVRDRLLRGRRGFVGEGGPRGGRWWHEARDCVNEAVRGGGCHGEADEDVGGALACGEQVNADDGEAVAESSDNDAEEDVVEVETIAVESVHCLVPCLVRYVPNRVVDLVERGPRGLRWRGRSAKHRTVNFEVVFKIEKGGRRGVVE